MLQISDSLSCKPETGGVTRYSVGWRRRWVLAYTEKARSLRQCVAVKPNGERCRAWARWGDARQLCLVHSGGHHTGPMSEAARIGVRTVPLCHCVAYAWPHRPGGGLCRWPDNPEYICATAVGTHRFSRYRGPRAARQPKRVIHVGGIPRYRVRSGESGPWIEWRRTPVAVVSSIAVEGGTDLAAG